MGKIFKIVKVDKNKGLGSFIVFQKGTILNLFLNYRTKTGLILSLICVLLCPTTTSLFFGQPLITILSLVQIKFKIKPLSDWW
ncbi:hypothetical protein [Spiroplasma endosymbiont of Polydrusus formosus]|uniref:hypothetical protein n=1 Tax=Spiroplasma endosymbiont of Polydrusus formosus TaxID=3139326 RepID=UPI0035B502BE